MAKQYNCTDYFTTSGHAARHAKKHTGKKDAICPECNKAFTRKDNMEQHRRTHQNGRNAPKTAGESQAKKTKSQTKKPKPAPLETEMTAVDPCLPVSPASSLGMADGALAPAMQSSHPYQQDSYLQRSPYPDPTSFHLSHMMSMPVYGSMPLSSTSGLDTLAIAAATTNDGLKRKYAE